MKVLIVDDHELVRRGLALTVEDGIENAEAVEAGCTDEAVRLLEVSPVDIALVDVRMPGRDGIELLKEIKARWPEVPVVMLTTFDHASYARAALAAGAAGYLLKDSTPADLTQAMRAAMAGGGNVLSGKVAHGLFEEERHRARARPTSPRRPAELTPRETQILELLVGGRGNQGARRTTGSVGEDREGASRGDIPQARRRQSHTGRDDGHRHGYRVLTDRSDETGRSRWDCGRHRVARGSLRYGGHLMRISV